MFSKEERENQTFTKHHSNNCFSQESSMAAKVSRQKYEKQDIYMPSTYHP